MKTITLDTEKIKSAAILAEAERAATAAAPSAQAARTETPAPQAQPPQQPADPVPETAASPVEEQPLPKVQEAETSFDTSIYTKEISSDSVKTVTVDDLTEDVTKPAFDYEKYFEDLSESLKKGGSDNV